MQVSQKQVLVNHSKACLHLCAHILSNLSVQSKIKIKIITDTVFSDNNFDLHIILHIQIAHLFNTYIASI